MVAFRREKFVPRGGPNGGDGGFGADVVLEADPDLNTLVDLRYKSRYKASAGGAGAAGNKNGTSQSPLVIRVPVGTTVYNIDQERYTADLTYSGQTVIVARGGRGGKGNATFATATNQAPKYAEKGEPGESANLRLELRLLADVGVIGFPNCGKSTLIALVSNAKPKIADYPFTTLVPNLGVVRVGPTESFVMADVPGLIEGASEGVGLGHRFLRHIERTRALVHLVDCSPMTGRDPFEDYLAIRKELASYSPAIAERVEIIGLNKVDIPEARERAEVCLKQLQDHFAGEDAEKVIRLVSTATGEETQKLVWDAARVLREIPKHDTPVAEVDVVRIEGPEEEFTIERGSSGEYIVKGRHPERLVAMTDLENAQALRKLHARLSSLGVLKELARRGIRDNDTVRVGAFEFDWISDNPEAEEDPAEGNQP